MEVEPLLTPTENKLNEKLKTLITIVSIKTLNCSNKDVKKTKFSKWLIIHLRRKF